MITLTSKKYDIEEPIKIVDENNNTIYEFTMQITADEQLRIKHLLIDNQMKLKSKTEDEQYKTLMEYQDEFEKICFKEHRDEFKKKCGEGKYDEMVDTLYDFFMKIFIDKRISQISTMNTNLHRIIKN